MENKKQKTEPNKLILIGNGFDLAHGLKTSYKDFLAWVIKEEFKIGTVGKVIDFSNFHEYIKPTSLDYSTLNLDKINENIGINDIKLKFKNSLFEQIYHKVNMENWVDIEDEFYKQLISLFNKEYQIPNYSLHVLNSEFEQIKQLLEKYLISIKPDYVRPISKISHFFNDLPKFDETKTIHPVLICNFNYTGTVSNYLTNTTKIIYDDICFIHGEIERPINPIIFGYGDEKEENYLPMESSKNDNYLKYIKSFAYLKTPSYSKLLSFIDAGPYEVVIMGHSCGQSDRVLLKTIFEHVNCKEIIIKYYKRLDGSDDFDEKAKEIARSFTDKASFRKKVVHYQDERVTSLDNFPN